MRNTSEGELAELDGPGRRGGRLLLELAGQGTRHAPGQPEDRMDRLARHRGHQVAQLLADADHLLADLEAHLVDDAEDVPLGRRRIRADDEIGPAEEEEVQRVVFDHEGVVEELADLPAGGRRVHLVEVVEGLRRGHVVGHRADAADARGDLRHVLDAPPLDELLEAAQLRHLEVGAVDAAVVIEEDVDPAVSLEPCHGVDEDLAAHGATSSSSCGLAAGRTRRCSSEAGRL